MRQPAAGGAGGRVRGADRAARAAAVPVLLDTSGEPLRRGVAARPDIVKPNADELAELTGSHEPLQATRTPAGAAHAVVASLGAQGLLAHTPDGLWRATPPRRVHGVPTGAGDSAVAGLLSGLVQHLPWPTASPARSPSPRRPYWPPVAGEFDRQTYDTLLDQITVTTDATAA